MAIKNDTQFVIKNGVAIQPDIPHDGLELYYDVKGKKNTDNYKGTLLDMSGNGRHGTLSNFAYEGVSGFSGTPEGGLLLDDVDDKIVRPAISGIEYTSASRNLFNTITAEWESGTFDGTGLRIANNTRVRLINPELVEANVDYVVSVTTGYLISGRVNNATNAVWAQSFTFNSTDGNLLLVIKKVDESVVTTAMATTALIQLEKGSVATAYTPYIPLPIMTYQMNGNILSFEKDGTVKRTARDVNGNRIVVSRKGINLVRNGNFANGNSRWVSVASNQSVDGDFISNISNGQSTASSELQYVSLTNQDKYYISGSAMVTNSYCVDLSIRIYSLVIGSIVNPIANNWYSFSKIITADSYSTDIRGRHQYADIAIANGKVMNLKYPVIINLTQAYGAGNEPTLAYIQAHPEEFAWTPNPNDLIETVEIKNNLVGDLENLQGNDFEQHEDGVVTYTNEAEEGSVVRVDIDGISDQPLRFRNATGEQVVITEHDQVDEDAIKKIEFAGESVQLADKYREASGTTLTVDPTLHEKTTIDKLVIGGTTVQKSDYYAKDGLITQSSNYYAKDGLSSQYVDTKTLGKNIFDSSKLGLNAYVRKDSGNSFIVSGGYSNSMTVLNPPFMGLLPNTSYTASMLVSGTGTLSASYGRVSLFNGTSWLHLNVGSTSGAKTTTFTTPSNISSYTQFFVYGSSDSLAVVTVSNIQLELGASATAFEPYKDTVKSGLVMELSGRNFFNDPATTTLQDRSGNGNVGTASGFQYRTTEYADRTADFTGKVSGSVVANPNIAKRTVTNSGSTSLLVPSSGVFLELDDVSYTALQTINGVSRTTTTNNLDAIPQQLFSFNVIAEFEKAYGAVPSADQTVAGKVAWLKANCGDLKFRWYGYGSCPSGNLAKCSVYTTGGSWSAPPTQHISPSVTLNSMWSVSVIQNDGFAHMLAYTDASDGITTSTIYTDYVSLTLTFKPASGSDGAGGIKFDGVDDYVVSTNPLNTQNSSFTLEATVRKDSSSTDLGMIVTLINNTYLSFSNNRFLFSVGMDTQRTLSGVNYLTTGNYYHVCAICDGSILKIYVDGVLVNSVDTGNAFNSSKLSTTVKLGGYINSSYPLNGNVKNARIYNRALSASEVYQNYMAGANLNLPAPTDPSPVTSNLPAKTYKYTDGSDIYEFTLPEELRGIGTSVDKVVFDKVSKKAFVERRVGKVVFNGAENWGRSACLNPNGEINYYFVLNTPNNISATMALTFNQKSDKFKIANPYNSVEQQVPYSQDCIWAYFNTYRIRMADNRSLESFKTWLASNTPSLYHGINTVTSTPITFTKVTSSPYTEVPMTFLTATPDPLHPADLYSNLPANTYKYTSTDGIYEFTLPEELRGIGTAYDKIVFDRVSHVGYLERRIKKYTVTGAESVGSLTNNGYEFYIALPTPDANTSTTSLNAKCTHYLGVTRNETYNSSVDLSCSVAGAHMRFRHNSFNGDSAGLRSYLLGLYNCGNPVIVQYILAEAVRTPLTFTKVTSSTKTEVPMAFLTNTPSLDYPASILSVESGSKVITHGKNLFNRSTAVEGYALTWAGGIDFATADSLRSDFIKVTTGKTYKINYKAQVMLFNENYTYMGSYNGEAVDRTEFSILGANSCIYIKLGFRSVSNSNINMMSVNIQVEEGAIATAYEPFKGYQETTIPVTLRSIG